MADTEKAPAGDGGEKIGEKEQNKAASPKPDTEVAPPLVSVKGKLLHYNYPPLSTNV